MSSNIFMCNLHPNTAEIDMMFHFKKHTDKISFIKICRDHTTSDSLKYGFMKYDGNLQGKLIFQ